jgi:hypothetical protein
VNDRFLQPTPQIAADAQALLAAMSLVAQGDWCAAGGAVGTLDGEYQRIVTAYGYVAGLLVDRLAHATLATPLMVLDALVLDLAAERAR